MSSRKRGAPENNHVRRRRNNLNEVIIISYNETEIGVVADSPEPKPITPGRQTTRLTSSPSRTSGMRGCWPFRKRKTMMMQGQSSRANEPVMRSEILGHCPPMFINHYPYPSPPPLQEPVQLSQYRLENPYRRTTLPELNQCGWYLQEIPEGHPNYMPLMPSLPVETSSDEDYEEALQSYNTDGSIDPQQWKEWVDSFNTPPH